MTFIPSERTTTVTNSVAPSYCVFHDELLTSINLLTSENLPVYRTLHDIFLFSNRKSNYSPFPEHTHGLKKETKIVVTN